MRAERASAGADATSLSMRTSVEALVVSEEKEADLVALDDALKGLAAIDPRRSQLVELRFFGGLSVQETAEVLKTSPRTVLREWSLAQAWLYRELRKGDNKSDG